jgi:hypothetical protein
MKASGVSQGVNRRRSEPDNSPTNCKNAWRCTHSTTRSRGLVFSDVTSSSPALVEAICTKVSSSMETRRFSEIFTPKNTQLQSTHLWCSLPAYAVPWFIIYVPYCIEILCYLGFVHRLKISRHFIFETGSLSILGQERRHLVCL